MKKVQLSAIFNQKNILLLCATLFVFTPNYVFATGLTDNKSGGQNACNSNVLGDGPNVVIEAVWCRPCEDTTTTNCSLSVNTTNASCTYNGSCKSGYDNMQNYNEYNMYCLPKGFDVSYSCDEGELKTTTPDLPVDVSACNNNPTQECANNLNYRAYYGLSYTIRDGDDECDAPAGRRFKNWNCSDIGNLSGGNTITYNYTTNMTCTAIYTALKYDVRYYCSSDTDTPALTDSNIEDGNSYSLKSNSQCSLAGHHFDYWKDRNKNLYYRVGTNFQTLHSDLNLEPVWVPDTETIIFNPNGGCFSAQSTSQISGNDSVINCSQYSNSSECPINACQWSASGACVNTTVPSEPEGISCVAGSNENYNCSVPYGTQIVFGTDVPDPVLVGNVFGGWNCTNGKSYSYSDSETWNYTNSVSCTAQWAQNLINITWLNDKDGTTLSTNYCWYGDNMVFPSTPTKTGYKFVGWLTDAEVNENGQPVHALENPQ